MCDVPMATALTFCTSNGGTVTRVKLSTSSTSPDVADSDFLSRPNLLHLENQNSDTTVLGLFHQMYLLLPQANSRPFSLMTTVQSVPQYIFFSLCLNETVCGTGCVVKFPKPSRPVQK